MKVKLFSNYEQSDKLLERFKANYPIYDNQLKFVNTDDYDFAIVFNGANEPVRSEAKVITVIQEPSWSILPQNHYLINSDYLLIHDPQLFERNHQIKLGGKVIPSPAYMFYDDRVDHTFFDTAAYIQKDKKISMIVSSLYIEVGNYGKRFELLSKILDSDLDIDLYGRGWNIPDQRYKGSLVNKSDGLLPYEYSIAIENSNEENYITEKFVDCVLCNTIPIYSGAPNIKEVYDRRYFKELDLDSNTIIEDIKSIISHPAPKSSINKEIYFNRYNLYTKLKDIILNS